MKIFKLFALVILVFNVGLNISLAQKKVIFPIKPKDFNELQLDGNYKILAEGISSKVDSPFVFVAREAKSYTQLQTLVEGLPDVSTVDFKRFAVVAGFAGEKPTGGYSVVVRKTNGKYYVEVKSPSKNSMVTQMITAPFQVAKIPIDENEGLPINLSNDFSKTMKTFQLTKNKFGFTGGFVGMKKEFRAIGAVNLLQYKDFVTMTFNLKGTGKEAKRRLFETATGTLNDGKIELARLDAGTFSDSPHPPFAVNGLLQKKNLSLMFESAFPSVADGYNGFGSLVAIKNR